jgi:hypothetical protein
MLTSVNLNNELGFMAIKVSNVIADRLLPLKSDFIFAQKAIPHAFFLRSCIFAKIFRQNDILFSDI